MTGPGRRQVVAVLLTGLMLVGTVAAVHAAGPPGDMTPGATSPTVSSAAVTDDGFAPTPDSTGGFRAATGGAGTNDHGAALGDAAADGGQAGLDGEDVATASPADFGYGSMTVDGVRAQGTRPVLVVRVDYEDTAFDADHTRDFYWRTMENVSRYSRENSRGSFTWGPVNLVGTYTVTDDPGTDWDEGRRDCWWAEDACDGRPTDDRFSLFLQTALRLADDDIDYSRYDRNDDGELTSGEVAVVVIGASSSPGDGGATRWTCSAGRLELDGVETCLSASGMGEGVGFGTLTHEMAHQLGTVDLYGSNCLNQNVTLMGCTIFGVRDSRASFHLDPWHKIQLGWAEPRILSTDAFRTRGQCLTLDALDGAGDYHTRDQRRPVVLYDPDRYDTDTRTGEFYILEYRVRESFDGGLADQGLAIWYVQMRDGELVYLDAEVRPDGPSVNDTGDLDSTRGGDDVQRGNEIFPGPNGRIDTDVPTGDDGKRLDGVPTDALNFLVSPDGLEGGTPRNDSWRGDNALWRAGHGEARLTWFDGTPVRVPLQVVGLNHADDQVVVLNTRTMRLDSATAVASPDSRIRLDGLFGAGYTNRSVGYKQVRLGGASRDRLLRYSWQCGAIVAKVTEDVEPGIYQLWVEDPATGVATERVDLRVRTVVDHGVWEGTYLGSLDGRRVRLEIEANVEFDYTVTLTDLDSGVVYRGTQPVTDAHVMEDLELASDGGETVVVPRLVFHRNRYEHLTGVAEMDGGLYGFALSEDWLWVESEAGPLDRSAPEQWVEQWRGDYHGRVDGERATLSVSGGEHVTFGTLRPGEGYRFDVEVYVPAWDATYRGSGLVDLTGGTHGVYVMEVGRLTSSEGDLREVVFRLHTDDVSHVSATALDGESDLGYGPRAERVGMQFATDWIDHRLVEALDAIEADDVPSAARPIVGDERVNLHVGTGVIGVYTDEAGVPSGREPSGFDEPTLNIYVSRETMDEILDSPDPVAAAEEAFLAGDIRYESPSILGSVAVAAVKVVVEVYKFVSGIGSWLSGLF